MKKKPNILTDIFPCKNKLLGQLRHGGSIYNILLLLIILS